MSQNDLSIANQGFASFRSDLNSALQALGSTNSGTSAPSTTYANQLFYDTTNNILKIRNEDNDAFISLFTLDQSNDNIESLTVNGVLTADSLVANGGVTIDNITIDGTEIDLSSGDLSLDVAGDIILDADGGDVAFRDGGTGHLQISNVSNDAKILSLQTDKDIIFSGIDGGSEIEAMRIDMSAGGFVGINTSTPDDILEVKGKTNTTTRQVKIVDSSDATATHIGQFSNISYFTNNTFYNGSAWTRDDGAVGTAFLGLGDGVVQFGTDTGATPNERMRIDSSGNVMIGETSQVNGGFVTLATSGASNALSFMCRSTDNGHQNQIIMQKSSTNSGNFAATSDNESLGQILFRGVNTSSVSDIGAYIEVVQDGTSSSTVPAEMRFGTTETERMRINSGGIVTIGGTNTSLSGTDSDEFIILENDGDFKMQGASKAIMTLNRNGTDGTIMLFQHENTNEGSISSSGTTISFDGFAGRHESSGISTDTEKGTVVSTIDELDIYPAKQGEGKDEQDNPKAGQTRADHAKVKISDTVGDKRVYGVVDSFTTHDKLMVVSVGIGSIKVTGACEGGDLLESNGDGTAKVQSDDIVRSKTIGKVTIGNSNTGVKLCSCVLYCG